MIGYGGTQFVARADTRAKLFGRLSRVCGPLGLAGVLGLGVARHDLATVAPWLPVAAMGVVLVAVFLLWLCLSVLALRWSSIVARVTVSVGLVSASIIEKDDAVASSAQEGGFAATSPFSSLVAEQATHLLLSAMEEVHQAEGNWGPQPDEPIEMGPRWHWGDVAVV